MNREDKIEVKQLGVNLWDDEKAEEIRQRFFEMHKKFNETPFDELGQMDTKTATGIDPDEFLNLTAKIPPINSVEINGTLYKRVLELEEENKYLKMSNPEQNLEHFRIVGENQRKIKNLRYTNKQLLEKVNKLEKENEYLKRKIDLYY